MSLKLYIDNTFASPYAMSAFIALTEKKLPFTLETMDLAGGQCRLPEYRDFSLTARVPALVHDDFVLTESSAIAEYLDDAFPSPEHPALLPKDARKRARARQIQSWLRSDLLPIRTERNTESVFFKKPVQPLSDEARACADKLIHACEQWIDGPNLFGRWSIADTDLAMMLNRLVLNGDTLPQRLRDYAAAQWQRPSMQQWLAHHQPG